MKSKKKSTTKPKRIPTARQLAALAKGRKKLAEKRRRASRKNKW